MLTRAPRVNRAAVRASDVLSGTCEAGEGVEPGRKPRVSCRVSIVVLEACAGAKVTLDLG